MHPIMEHIFISLAIGNNYTLFALQIDWSLRNM